jgi:hypothetical protein
MQVDPIRYSDSANLYLGFGSNPVNLTDAMGLSPKPPILPYASPSTPPPPPPADIAVRASKVIQSARVMWPIFANTPRLKPVVTITRCGGAIGVAAGVGAAAGTIADELSDNVGRAIYGPEAGDAKTSDVIGDWIYWYLLGGSEAPGMYNPRPQRQ